MTRSRNANACAAHRGRLQPRGGAGRFIDAASSTAPTAASRQEPQEPRSPWPGLAALRTMARWSTTNEHGWSRPSPSTGPEQRGGSTPPGCWPTNGDPRRRGSIRPRRPCYSRRSRSTAVLDGTVHFTTRPSPTDRSLPRCTDPTRRRVGRKPLDRATCVRRAAQQEARHAQARTHDAQVLALGRWGSVPASGRWAATTRDGLDAWAARVTHQRAEAQPVVASARQDVARADEALKQTRWRHRAETEDLTLRIYGRRDAASVRTVSGVHSAQARAQRWRQYADAARADLTRIESLPIGRAVQFIESLRARALQVEVERTAATHSARLGVPTERRIGQTDPELRHSM